MAAQNTIIIAQLLQSKHFFFSFLLLTLFGCVVHGQTFQEILQAGICEHFDQEPIGCQGILVGPWSSVWTAPAYGLTQEYFHALMNIPSPPNNIAPIDLVNGLPVDCAAQYLKMICPAYFRPCTTTSNQSLIPYPVLPHPVCRSVCEEFNFICSSYLESIGLTSFNCSALDPFTEQALFPSDFQNPQTEPLYCTRIENSELGPISYNCPPPLKLSGFDDQNFGISCSYPCPVVITLAWNLGNDTEPMFVTYSVLSWISFVLVCITLGVYASQRRFWQWPSRMILFGGYGLFWMHLSAIGSVFYTYSDLQCADEWTFQFYSWCKFSSWALIYGSMQTACWWLVQTLVITWKLGFRGKSHLIQRFEPLFHLFCWSFPLISAFTSTFIPDQTASGGSLGGLPFCGFAISVNNGIEYGLYVGPLSFFLLIVICCILFSVFGVIRAFVAKETKKPTKYIISYLSVLAFSLIFVNVIVSVLTQTFWAFVDTNNIFNAIFVFTQCLITTLINLGACNVETTGNLAIYWYFSISVATTGTGYAIVFLSLYIRILRMERNIIDPDRMIAKRSRRISKTGSSTSI